MPNLESICFFLYFRSPILSTCLFFCVRPFFACSVASFQKMAGEDKAKIVSVESSTEVKMTRFQLNKVESLFAEPLLISREIIHQQENIWSKRTLGETARRLRGAKNFINSMLLALVNLHQKEEFELFFQLALFGKEYEEIIRCVRCFKDATELETNRMLEHRSQIKNAIIRFLDLLGGYVNLKFGKWVSGDGPFVLIEKFEAVNITVDLIDEIL